MTQLTRRFAGRLAGKMLAGFAFAAGSASAQVSAPAPAAENAPAAADEAGTGEIVVTARQRGETLLSVPVAVSAVSGATLRNYGVTDVRDLGKLATSLAIARGSSGSGGTLSLRGISTSPQQEGFEQAVSINIDGVQTSRARVLNEGLFDIDQVEVLKGPQALFFGKNSPAGVLSIHTAGPTEHLEAYVRTGYEFVADEKIVEGAISGPLTDALGARLAVRYRNMDGYFRNVASGPLPASPFGQGQVTTGHLRPGEKELLGRGTLAYKPAGGNFDATLKASADHYQSDGVTAGQQLYNCGAFAAGITFLKLDPYADCKFDRNYSSSALPAGVADNWPYAKQEPYLDTKIYRIGLTMNYNFADLTLTSVTGYLNINNDSFDNFDATSYFIVAGAEHEKYHSFSQELRLLSHFDAPVNFLLGGFYDDTKEYYFNSSRVTTAPVDPATGKYQTWERPSGTSGNTYSLFGQLIWGVTEHIELAGGVRYTKEDKDSYSGHTYVHPPLGGTVYSVAGRVVTDTFKDSNYSPEATLTWRPTKELTAYAAYKTGYKSGGFALSNALSPPLVTAPTFRFKSEHIKGFEVGVKGQFLDRRLTLTSAAYTYKYSNLQVTTFNAATTAYSVSNAASARVKGIELDAVFRPVRMVSLYASGAYNRARYQDYLTNCYGGQTFAQGCNVSVSAGADGIPNTADDRYSQNLAGKPLPRAPEFTMNAGFTADQPVSDRFKLGVSGNARYSDRFYGIENASPAGIQNHYWVFDAAARVATIDDRWELSLIGRNLGNRYYTSVITEKPGAAVTPGTPSQTRAAPERGRQVLLQATVRM